MDAEWLNDTSTLIPPNAQPDDEFSYSFTIQPSARNYINAKPPKSVNASDDPYSATPPQLQPQLVKCNSVDDLRRIIFQRFSRALIGRALCDKMDVLLKPGNGRSKADVVGEWQLKAVTVVDMVNYFFFRHNNRLYFFCGTELPAWITTNKNYSSVSRDFLKSVDGKNVELRIARLGFHL